MITLRLWVWALLLGINGMVSAYEPCRIEIVEQGSGWPVPLVELRTVHQARFVSDNAGVIAFDMPELMGQETWFDVHGHGYEVAKDGMGYRGVRVTPQPGKAIRLEVKRTNVARRLGRITGAGLFAESEKTGLKLDSSKTLILGCDTVQNAVYQGRLFWFWGDTMVPRYPLGIFDATGASSSLNPIEHLTISGHKEPSSRSDYPSPPLKINFDYFTTDHGAVRAVAAMPGEGPTWLTACCVVPDRSGKPRLVASYMKIKPPLDAYEWGLCVWDDRKSTFERLRAIWSKNEANPKPPALPDGHAVVWKDERGKEWVLFGNPLPTLRCPATFESCQDPSAWEVLKPQESLLAVRTGEKVKPHSGRIAWNDWRKRWVTIFMEKFGKPSDFGEIWYAESKTPTGPWGRAVKVVSHDNYTFYNPSIHPEFATNTPVLLFEGSFTKTFANNPEPVPRHEYNQVLYRLDLDDPALAGCHEP